MKSKYYKENRKIFNNAKTKCCLCGESNKCCLEFHHNLEKHFNISKSLKYITPKQLIDELKLTCCVCSNCHKKIHNNIKYGDNKQITEG